MRKRIALSLLFLLVGLIIYYMYNIKILSRDSVLLLFIRNYIPDFCWAFSFFFISINFTKNIVEKSILFNFIWIMSISFIFELFQKCNYVKGTYDFYDIITYFISILLACCIEINLRRKENEKEM